MNEQDLQSSEEWLGRDDVPEVTCPSCDGGPEVPLDTKRNLSDLGYLHGDIDLRCESCGHTWSHGVPVEGGNSPMGELLRCHVCDGGPMLVHRITYNREMDREGRDGAHLLTLHLKCPDCKYFRKVHRTTDRDGICLVGYPEITGDLDSASPRGWSEWEIERIVSDEYEDWFDLPD